MYPLLLISEEPVEQVLIAFIDLSESQTAQRMRRHLALHMGSSPCYCDGRARSSSNRDPLTLTYSLD